MWQRILHNDQDINPWRRYNNYIYTPNIRVPKYEANAKYEANVNRYKETDSSTIVVGPTLTCCIIG